MSKEKVISESTISEDLKKQREFLKKLEEDNFDFGIVVGKAFVKGMRDLGYKSNGTALNELVDNSIQSEATRSDIIFGFKNGNEKKTSPDMMAIIDNGHGMDPQMIRVAAMWGGTHRQDDRTGFGRYGYGLPSACVSIGESFTIISKVEGKDAFGLTIDLQDISNGKYADDTGRIVVPEASAIRIPKWVNEYIVEHYGGNFDNGTIIIIDKIDRLDYVTVKRMKELLLQNFGSTYRNYFRNFNIYVDAIKVEPIDPLFLTPGFRFYDEDSDKAISYPELFVDVKNKNGEIKGKIKARFSLMPPTFMRIPEHKLQERGTNNNRFKIRKEHNGIIVMRAGRQIDVVNSKCPWMTFQNNDRYIGIELDFPPYLDEEFSITTSKQQVVLKDKVWDILDKAGVYNAIKKVKADYEILWKDHRKKIQDEIENENKRLSEIAMEEASKFDTKSKQLPLGIQKEQEQSFNDEVKDRAQKTGKPEGQIKEELLLEINSKPYYVLEDNLPGAPFFRVEQLGGQKRLYINKDHRFYKDIYMGPNSTSMLRYNLEVLLFVIGECELSSEDERKLFYQTEKQEWSKNLNIALDKLSKWRSDDDDNLASEEEKAQAEILEIERKSKKEAS